MKSQFSLSLKVLPMKALCLTLFSVFICFPTYSQISTNANENPAKAELKKLSHALNTLNFSTSFVVVKNNQAEPYHWLHGVGDNKLPLTILARLNGPRRDILQKGNVVSYIEPEFAPYSVHADNISGPIPAIFNGDISEIEAYYHFVLVGRSRVLGRAAQLIRIVPKDADRLGYWVWLDLNSSLLLKLAILSANGKMLEQIQFTHLDITENVSANLLKLQASALPDVITSDNVSSIQDDKSTVEATSDEKNKQLTDTAINWKVNWLPKGFQLVKSNNHQLSHSKKAVQFMLFSDGLVDISVYVSSAAQEQQPLGYAYDGATVVLTKVFNELAVSIVGKIPTSTAVKIADSVSNIH